MSYKLKEVTIRTNNSEEGMKEINDLWKDIVNGNIPIIFDSKHVFQEKISPVSKYSNYASDENGTYDLTVMGVTADFFKEMEEKVVKGLYKKYDVADENNKLDICIKKAGNQVWDDSKNKRIHRTFTKDYESSVPAEYTKDKKAHCYLYIAVK